MVDLVTHVFILLELYIDVKTLLLWDIFVVVHLEWYLIKNELYGLDIKLYFILN